MKSLRLIRLTKNNLNHLRTIRLISTTSTLNANSLLQASTPAPPPPPPSLSQDAQIRLARKRAQLEQSTSKKRFWKAVHVVETPQGLQVLLDKRPVRTPTKEIVTVPTSKPHLATGIALEWDALPSLMHALKPHAIPLTSLVSRGMDLSQPEAAGLREDVVDVVMRYFHTDTLLCWAPEEGDQGRGIGLRERQIASATPIINYLSTKVWPGVLIEPVLEEGHFLPKEHPIETIQVVRSWLLSLPGWELAALERAVLATKSFLLATRVLVEWGHEFAQVRGKTDGKKFGIEDTVEASTVELRWQTEQWGEVDDTHDVDKEDLRRQIGGVILMVNSTGKN
jgi:chaperone required for assembly of F1-ATPase